MASLPSSSFGTLLRRLREAAGLTQAELARRAGLSREAISVLERVAGRAPRRDTVELLADALGLLGATRAHFAAAARGATAPSASFSDAPVASSVRMSAADTPPLVDRDEELARLDRHLAGAGPPLLLLAGEPGIGKSRLLREAAGRAAAAGWTVLQGGCTRRSGQEPYAPLPAALAEHLAALARARRRAALDGCGWLVRLLPELAEARLVPAPAWTLPAEQERRLLFAAAGRLLANVAGPSGTLLVLDDLQWVGADALDLLATLAGAPMRPTRVLGACRSTEVDARHPLAALVADLGRDGLAERAELGPLPPRAAREVVAGVLGADAAQAPAAERLVERAGGVPFFLVSGARALAATATGASEHDVVPWDIGQSVRQRIALQPEEVGEVLQIAAVAGRHLAHALLLAVAGRLGRRPREILHGVEAALRARLLVESAEDYQFTHDLIGEVVAADLSAARRRFLHREIAEALEEGLAAPARRQRAGELAWHLMGAGELARALPYALCAGDDATAVYAHADAERDYRWALDLARQVGRREHEAEAAFKLAGALWTLGRLDDALVALERAAREYRALDDHEGELRVLAQIIQIHGDRGTPDAGLARADSALRGEASPAGDVASAGLTLLCLRAADVLFRAARYDEQLTMALRAERLARSVGDESLLAQALHLRVLAEWNTRSSGDTLSTVMALIPLAERLQDAWLLFRVLGYAASMLSYLGDYMRGAPYPERALEVAERLIGEPSRIAFSLVVSADYAFCMGEWARARTALERSLALMRETDPSETTLRSAYPHIWLGMLDLAEGRAGAGEGHLERGLAIALPISDLQAVRTAQAALAERDLLAGRAIDAHARLAPLLDRPGLREPNVTQLVLPLLAWAQLDLGLEEQAAATLQEAIARARATGARYPLVDALRVQATLHLRRRCWTEAATALRESIALSRAMPQPYSEAKALWVLAQLHHAHGRPAPARARLLAALAILRRLGERPYAACVERTLAELHGTAGDARP